MRPGNPSLPLAPLLGTATLFALYHLGKFKILVIAEWPVRSQVLNSLWAGATGTRVLSQPLGLWVRLGLPGETVPVHPCRWERPLPDTSLPQALESEGSPILGPHSEMGQQRSPLPSALARSLRPQSHAGPAQGSRCLHCCLFRLPGSNIEDSTLSATSHLPAGLHAAPS